MKLRIFLLEAGLLDTVSIVEGQSPEEHQKLSNFLVERVGKASFPTAEISRGRYMPESDDLVAHFASANGIDPSKLTTYQAFTGSLLPHFQKIYRDYLELREAQEAT